MKWNIYNICEEQELINKNHELKTQTCSVHPCNCCNMNNVYNNGGHLDFLKKVIENKYSWLPKTNKIIEGGDGGLFDQNEQIILVTLLKCVKSTVKGFEIIAKHNLLG